MPRDSCGPRKSTWQSLQGSLLNTYVQIRTRLLLNGAFPPKWPVALTLQSWFLNRTRICPCLSGMWWMSPETHLCFAVQGQAPTKALKPFLGKLAGFPMPLHHGSSDSTCHSLLRVPSIPSLLSMDLPPPLLKTGTDACVQTFIFHFPCFMGPEFSSGALKSFCTGLFVPHSAISGPILAHFSLIHLKSAGCTQNPHF